MLEICFIKHGPAVIAFQKYGVEPLAMVLLVIGSFTLLFSFSPGLFRR